MHKSYIYCIATKEGHKWVLMSWRVCCVFYVGSICWGLVNSKLHYIAFWKRDRASHVGWYDPLFHFSHCFLGHHLFFLPFYPLLHLSPLSHCFTRLVHSFWKRKTPFEEFVLVGFSSKFCYCWCLNTSKQ